MLMSAPAQAAPDTADIIELRWRAQAASGTEIGFRLLRPRETPTPLPVLVVLGGFERGAAALDLLPEHETVMLAGFDYPLSLPKHIAWREVPELMGQIERGIADTRAALMLLFEHLADNPAVDAERISVIGASLGAPFAIIAAGDSPYRAVVVVHGFADVPLTLRHQFARRWRPEYGRLGSLAAWATQTLLTTCIDYPDPYRSIDQLRSAQQVLLIQAADDDFIPRAARKGLVEAMHRSAAEVTVAQTAGRHLRGNREATLAQIYALAEPWLESRDLL